MPLKRTANERTLGAAAPPTAPTPSGRRPRHRSSPRTTTDVGKRTRWTTLNFDRNFDRGIVKLELFFATTSRRHGVPGLDSKGCG
mmetsp:Transcript_18082/g.53547  ORF Transcript_18082/g.53547 Transcript_18082/m.53547 type:complete len:85 (-) Transcript_18082:103-357(-)